jgi:hypothetical protein
MEHREKKRWRGRNGSNNDKCDEMMRRMRALLDVGMGNGCMASWKLESLVRAMCTCGYQETRFDIAKRKDNAGWAGKLEVTQDRTGFDGLSVNEVWLMGQGLGLMFCLDNRRVDSEA